MNLTTYIDDSSGFDYEDDLLRYEPYGASFPHHQTMLLQLWDELSIPHKPRKQIFGLVIPVIGINVDPNEMTLTLSVEHRRDLCDALYAWAIKPVGRKSNYQLKHWQQMGFGSIGHSTSFPSSALASIIFIAKSPAFITRLAVFGLTIPLETTYFGQPIISNQQVVFACSGLRIGIPFPPIS